MDWVSALITYGTILVLLIGFFAARYLSALGRYIDFYRTLHRDVKPGTPQGVPGFNLSGCDAVTAQMEQLGFVRVEDQRIGTYSFKGKLASPQMAPDRPPIADPLSSPAAKVALRPYVFQSFVRVMVHPEHGCFGKIHFQLRVGTRKKNSPPAMLSLSVSSITGTSQEDWYYATITNNYTAAQRNVSKLLRRPRQLSTHVPEGQPAELLSLHLQRRAAIAQLTGRNWQPTVTLEDDRIISEASLSEARATYLGLTPLKMALKLLALSREKSFGWMGELTGRFN